MQTVRWCLCRTPWRTGSSCTSWRGSLGCSGADLICCRQTGAAALRTLLHAARFSVSMECVSVQGSGKRVQVRCLKSRTAAAPCCSLPEHVCPCCPLPEHVRPCCTHHTPPPLGLLCLPCRCSYRAMSMPQEHAQGWRTCHPPTLPSPLSWRTASSA